MNETVFTVTPKAQTAFTPLFDLKRHINNGDYMPHQHSSIELSIVMGGRARHIIDGQPYDAQAGDVFIIHPGIIHELLDRRQFDEVTIGCTPGAFLTLVPEIKFSAGFNTTFFSALPKSTVRPWLRIPADEFEYVKELLLDMLAENERRRIGWQSMINSCFCRLLVILVRHYNRKEEKRNPSLQRLNETISYMATSFGESITLEALAKRTGLSQSQFIRIFQQYYQMTPIQYLIDLRLSHACHLILSTPMTITEIAYACGFQDSNYFTRQFKKRIGVPPQTYRHEQISTVD